MKSHGRDSGHKFFILLSLIFFICLFFGMAFLWGRLESNAPILRLNYTGKYLGRKPDLKLIVEESGSGLKNMSIQIKLKNSLVPLVQESFPSKGWFLRNSVSKEIREWDLGPFVSKLITPQETAFAIVAEAHDQSLRGWFSGNRGSLQQEFQIKLTPPRLEVLSSQHYINLGGCEFVLYRISPDAETSGVQVGSNFFPGFPANLPDPNVRFAPFAFAYYLPLDTPIRLIARDGAGNQSVATFWYKLFPKKFRSRDMNLEDSFLQKVVPEILSHTPEISEQGKLIDTFLQINRQLRGKNHQTVADLARKSPSHFLWREPFVQLSNSKVEANFSDHRRYFYKGEEIDQQDHIGFDLSVTQQVPIEAANDGTVVLARYFGIYGNAVLLDHGCGLLSLYGHMSSISVQEGQTIKKKEILGRSGATGLAGGDHLHFGLFLQGVPVNPTEWWDPHWVQVHLRDRLK
jgi:murein DD-endopeptidase MepM/ murein hydrolase activator NlpD